MVRKKKNYYYLECTKNFCNLFQYVIDQIYQHSVTMNELKIKRITNEYISILFSTHPIKPPLHSNYANNSTSAYKLVCPSGENL